MHAKFCSNISDVPDIRVFLIFNMVALWYVGVTVRLHWTISEGCLVSNQLIQIYEDPICHFEIAALLFRCSDLSSGFLGAVLELSTKQLHGQPIMVLTTY